MKTAVIGSRTFNDYKLLTETLDDENISEIITGGAKGADQLAEKYAKENNVNVIVIRPDYKKYHFKKAPIMRNYQIVDMADKIIAFWDGASRGTKSVIDYSKNKGKEIKIVYYENKERDLTL